MKEKSLSERIKEFNKRFHIPKGNEYCQITKKDIEERDKLDAYAVERLKKDCLICGKEKGRNQRINPKHPLCSECQHTIGNRKVLVAKLNHKIDEIMGSFK